MNRYAERYARVFRQEPAANPSWIHYPFAWGTPEADEMQRLIWQVENRLWTRFLETVRDEQIVGDLVEFGVFDGSSLVCLADACDRLGLRVPIYGFDSFEGLPEPSEHDLPCWQKGQYAAAMETVAERLRVDERPWIRLIKGWFADTLADTRLIAPIERVAFARIDCDLYEPAVDCLRFLEPRLVNGAFLCFDDWTDNPDTGETRAFFEFAERVSGRLAFRPVARISLGGMHMRVVRA